MAQSPANKFQSHVLRRTFPNRFPIAPIQCSVTDAKQAGGEAKRLTVGRIIYAIDRGWWRYGTQRTAFIEWISIFDQFSDILTLTPPPKQQCQQSTTTMARKQKLDSGKGGMKNKTRLQPARAFLRPFNVASHRVRPPSTANEPLQQSLLDIFYLHVSSTTRVLDRL